MRQYIGARYVPKFADPFEWNAQMVYEPLTIVGYLGSSYTSRKQVPAGIVPTNNEYWALTGNVNGAVAEVQRQIEELTETVAEDVNNLQTNINNLENEVEKDIQNLQTNININTNTISTLKQSSLPNQFQNAKIRLFGDSWTKSTDPATRQPWSYYFQQMIPSSAILINQAISGSAISQPEATGIANVIAASPDDADTTHVIVFGGLNDWGTGLEIQNFKNKLVEIAQNLDSKYPNAKIIAIGIFDQKTRNSSANQFYPVLLYNMCWEFVAKEYNWQWLSPYHCPGWSGLKNSRYAQDGNPYHPTSEYAKIIANWIYTSILSGSQYNNPNINFSINALTAFEQTSNQVYKDVDFDAANISTFSIIVNSSGICHISITARPGEKTAGTELKITKRNPGYPSFNREVCVSIPYTGENANLVTAVGNTQLGTFIKIIEGSADLGIIFNFTYPISYLQNSTYTT